MRAQGRYRVVFVKIEKDQRTGFGSEFLLEHNDEQFWQVFAKTQIMGEQRSGCVSIARWSWEFLGRLSDAACTSAVVSSQVEVRYGIGHDG